MKTIFHVTTDLLWQQAIASSQYTCDSIALEGFIHCCEAEQMAGVLHRYYQGQENLLQLEIDVEKISAPLKYEGSPSVGEQFPHIYGALNLDAVIGITPIENI